MDYVKLITEPLSGDAGCGTNLEDDSSFQHFFFTAQGTPERFDGENTLAAEPPDWRTVKKAALSFLAHTKDIKLISVLSQAVLNTEGIEAYSQCLVGLSKLIQHEWQNLYPPLDEDDGDPLERLSGLAHLNDDFIVKSLKALPMASVKGIGIVTLESIELATNGSSHASLSISQIKGIFREINLAQVQLLYGALAYSLESLQSINQCFIDKAGYEYSVNFDRTTEVIGQLLAALEKYTDVGVTQLDQENDSSDKNSDAQDAEAGYPGDAQQQQHSRVTDMNKSLAGSNGLVESRADVEKCLKLINGYYARYEPSSPIPVLVNRALNLVNKDFMQLMQNLYPDALPALRQLGGFDEDSEDTDSEKADDSW
jgi:type VI secretion system protein ImpA